MGWKLHPSKLRYSPLKTVVSSSLAGETTASEHGHQQATGKGEGAAGACWAEGMRKLQHQPQDALQLQVVGVFPEHIDFNYSSWKGRVFRKWQQSVQE
jgi:hypothetical protein